MKVSQNGNTANNGFHNALILHDSTDVEISGSVSTAGIRHAFSLPAWDVLQDNPPKSITFPRWNRQQKKVNRLITTSRPFPRSLFLKHAINGQTQLYETLLQKFSSKKKRHFEVITFSNTEKIRRPNSAVRFSQFLILAKSKVLAISRVLLKDRELSLNSDIHITIGNSVPRISQTQCIKVKSVVLEHGQIRWILDGPTNQSLHRIDFRKLCTQADHIWVTNVDQRTLDISDELFPNRWSVLPHPYLLDPFAPYGLSSTHRSEMIKTLNSDFLIFSASSLSISGDQKKGTPKLLNALRHIKENHGIRVGLVLVNWGNDKEEIYSLIRRLDIADQCSFVSPLPRIEMQRFMNIFDLVADQFDYDAFGALTIRTLEQGAPLLSRSIGDSAAKLMGRRPPVIHASTIEEVVQQILYCIERQATIGRDDYLNEYKLSARKWITERHHHSFTKDLQCERYLQLLDSELIPAIPGRWGQLPDWHQ